MKLLTDKTSEGKKKFVVFPAGTKINSAERRGKYFLVRIGTHKWLAKPEEVEMEEEAKA